ncbi:MAG: TlpA family protein disulfide reductase [Oscillospiraceae bacterium]|nr:TlpA family protein disulfide reductase [Oscillospiraceae bacterium]
MKNSMRWLVPALALAVVIAVAALLYPRLAMRYAPEDKPSAAAPAQETAAAAAQPASTPDASTAPDVTATVIAPESAASAEPAAADLAPDFEVLDGEGNTVRLSDFRGRPVVINFWATWCPPCRSELPAFDSLYAEYGDRIDFLMVDLTDGERETVSGVRDFVAEEGYAFPVYYDTAYSAAEAYQLYSIPVTVLIRPDGTVFTQQIGAMNEHAIRSYLNDLLSE